MSYQMQVIYGIAQLLTNMQNKAKQVIIISFIIYVKIQNDRGPEQWCKASALPKLA